MGAHVGGMFSLRLKTGIADLRIRDSERCELGAQELRSSGEGARALGAEATKRDSAEQSAHQRNLHCEHKEGEGGG